MTIKIEICVNSVESAIQAQAGGADRVELCENLFEGGTTPSLGAQKLARDRLKIGLHTMIRPRGGDFLYSELELDIMRADIDTAKRIGVDGVVFGMLTAEGNLDLGLIREFIELSRPLSVTIHRAFDVCIDPFAALEQLIELGADRILTSGQKPYAFEGIEMIADLVKQAGGRVGILACGDLRPENVRKLVTATGVREIHMAAFESLASEMKYRNERVFMGGALHPPEFMRSVTSVDAVTLTKMSLKNI